MLTKKILGSFLALGLIFSAQALAKPDKEYKVKKEKKEKKQKQIPYGLQKKMKNGGTLPPGWQKKVQKGEVADSKILDNGRILKSKVYENIENTDVYKVQERVFRVARDTKEILEILK